MEAGVIDKKTACGGKRNACQCANLELVRFVLVWLTQDNTKEHTDWPYSVTHMSPK